MISTMAREQDNDSAGHHGGRLGSSYNHYHQPVATLLPGSGHMPVRWQACHANEGVCTASIDIAALNMASSRASRHCLSLVLGRSEPNINKNHKITVSDSTWLELCDRDHTVFTTRSRHAFGSESVHRSTVCDAKSGHCAYKKQQARAASSQYGNGRAYHMQHPHFSLLEAS